MPAKDPTEKRLRTKEGVLFSWDGTHFKDGGTCLERTMHTGGALFLVACARLTSAGPGADPYTRPDGGTPVECISQQAQLGSIALGAPVAIVFNW